MIKIETKYFIILLSFLYTFDVYAHGGLNSLSGVGKGIGLLANYIVIAPILLSLISTALAALLSKESNKQVKLEPVVKNLLFFSILLSSPWVFEPELDIHTIILNISSVVFMITIIFLVFDKKIRHVSLVIYVMFLAIAFLSNSKVITYNNYIWVDEAPFESDLTALKVADPRFQLKSQRSKFIELSDGRILFNDLDYFKMPDADMEKGFPVVVKFNDSCSSRCVEVKTNDFKTEFKCEKPCMSISNIKKKRLKRPQAIFDFQKTDNFPVVEYKESPSTLINYPLKDMIMNSSYKTRLGNFQLVKTKSGNIVSKPLVYLLNENVCSNTNTDYSLNELLTKGADPNYLLESFKSTAFICAVEMGSVEKIKLLHKYGGDPNFKIKPYGYSPMMRAVDNTYDLDKRIKTLQLLVELGADIDAVDNNGYALLHKMVYGTSDSVYSNKINNETIKALLDLNANRNLRDKNGLTPLEYAVKKVKDIKERITQFKNSDRNYNKARIDSFLTTELEGYMANINVLQNN